MEDVDATAFQKTVAHKHVPPHSFSAEEVVCEWACVHVYALGDIRGAATSVAWHKDVEEIAWVAYTPPSGNPNQGIEATPDAIRRDLETLRSAEFTGLVTYGSAGVMGKEFLQIAEQAGFERGHHGDLGPQ